MLSFHPLSVIMLTTLLNSSLPTLLNVNILMWTDCGLELGISMCACRAMQWRFITSDNVSYSTAMLIQSANCYSVPSDLHSVTQHIYSGQL